ncbi:hypothetical protein [Oryzihumus leptocrescens]|uniref:Protein phosphatase 2C-like protein n=1 Tax=Oryzihumus leptocrescens TaxID=297536 RepID=A0A542ZFS4_9MICO|nr:hypothetical protein [Oryzihumus leptocrescens]TQL59195.1 hypothetical protein FB474_0543 [Oryzihumus leptocrescens]
MPPLTRLVLALATTVMVGACGSTSGSSLSSPATTSTTAAAGGSPTSLSAPLTVTRSGGVAGFRDRLVIGTDGVTSVSRHGEPTGRCRVDEALMHRIASAAAGVGWSSLRPPATQPRHPDDLVVVVSSGRSGARIEDPALTQLAEPLTRLLADVTAPAGQRRLCTTV